MTTTIQYTTDQVARQLSLSDAVVQRLSQYFQIPVAYYQAVPGKPKILLYTQAELDLLAEVQGRLVAGESLPHIKHALSQRLAAMVAAEAAKARPTMTPSSARAIAALQEGPAPDLVSYDQDEAMKEHLANVTFQQYKHDTRPQKAPLSALAQHFEEERTERNRASGGMSSPLATDNSNSGAWPKPEPSHPWMSPELQQRARELQRELRRMAHH